MWRDARWVEGRLADDSGEAGAELMQWSATNSRVEVADTLITVLGQNPPRGSNAETGCSFVVLLALAALVFGIFLSVAFQSAIPLIVVVAPFIYIVWRDMRRPKVARRAALMLARLDDPRAIAPLVACWRGGDHARENEPLAEEITRLLNEMLPREPPIEMAFPLRDFVERQFIGTTKRHAGDVTETEADLFVAALRGLARSSAPTMRDTLSRVARLKSAEPLRAVVIEAARVLLEPRPAPIAVSVTASLPPDPVQQHVFRRD